MIPLARPALLLFVAVLASGSIHAKTWIADSDPNHTADFRSAQEAHDGAEEGDVIYFVGSFRHYGDLIATKRLTYVGPGYFLGENNPNFQNLFPARLKTVSLTYEISNAPSDNVDPEEIISDSSGSVFQGVTIETQLHIIANDAVFKGCNIYYLNINNSSPFIPAGGIEKLEKVIFSKNTHEPPEKNFMSLTVTGAEIEGGVNMTPPPIYYGGYWGPICKG